MGNAAASFASLLCGGRSCPSPPPSALPPVALPEELVEEVLLRFPPDEPASLFRAALVCKPWCRLISGPRFRRRFREQHRTPPMLGSLLPIDGGVRFVPTTAFCPPGTGRCDWRALDARHGRVLGRRHVPEADEGALVVWNPITGEQQGLPFPPRLTLSWAAAVLCAGTAAGACDHLDCHRGPFLVVFVGLDPLDMFVCTYSSDFNAWSEPIRSEHLDPDKCCFIGVENHTVLVGNAFYFGIQLTNLILKYNLESGEMSLVQLPSAHEWNYERCCMLTTTEEGVLGLITVDHSKLRMWLMEDSTKLDAGWTQSRIVNLSTLLPYDGISTLPNVLGVADGLGIVFLMVGSVMYTIDLKTCKVEVYLDTRSYIVLYHDTRSNIVPYMSFYTPEL